MVQITLQPDTTQELSDFQMAAMQSKILSQPQKDQTYALYNLTQAQLSRTLMPVGDYHKDEIRQIAEEIGLMVAQKKDSMEICFIPDDDYAGFIDKECGNLVPPPGNFVSKDGKILGRHKGITHYTVGQRKGLELHLVTRCL